LAKGRPKSPTFKDSLAPRPDRQPRLNPGSDRVQKPSWLFAKLDFDGPWCWKRMDTVAALEVCARLAAFESMTWAEIEGKQNHPIPVERLPREAQERLILRGLDDYDSVLSLRITKRGRVWGVKTANGVLLLWWDPEHSVCPMNIADNGRAPGKEERPT
jgi:hypothetical protein